MSNMVTLGLYAGLAVGAAAQVPAPPKAGPASPHDLSHPALPPGLPRLPAIGERMSTDDLSGFALRGFDPVAYFVSGRPVAGLAEYEHTWAGAVWRFSSEANLRAFMAEPLAYAPLFDGYDAVAVADGRIVESDPRTFAILNDRLYFFRTEAGRDAFRSNAALLGKSTEAWPRTLRQLSR